MYQRHVPSWMKQGVRVVCDFEPLFFCRRRGGWFVDDEARKAATHSEAYIKHLAECGFNLFVVHGYKGFGLEFEKKEHHRVIQVSEYCRKYGVKLGTYCQVATLDLETARMHYPQAADWIQVNAHGQPVFYSCQTFRHIPCYNNPAYQTYYREVVRYMIEELKTDFLHFDNLTWLPEPNSCHCPFCQTAFRAFLQEHYADPERAEKRFGLSNFRFVTPPVCPAHPNWIEQPVKDPLFQEWYEFRAVSLEHFITDVSAYAASLNPEVGIEANVGSFPVRNRFRANGNWYPYLARAGHLQIVFNEDSEAKPLVRPRILGTNIQAIKCGKSVGLGIFGGGNYQTAVDAEKTLSERLAFAPDFNMWAYALDKYPDIYKRYFAFHQRHADFYHGTHEIRDVATIHSIHTVRMDSREGRLAAILGGQCLLRTGLPFSIGFDPLLESLDDLKALLLPHVEGMSDDQCRQVEAFVRHGGGLVVTDRTATLDEWARIRPTWGLGTIFGRADLPKRLERVTCGKGRAVYLPTILPAAIPETEPNEDRSEQWLRSRYWKLPTQYPAVLKSIEWAATLPWTARLKAPAECAVEFTRRTDTGAFVAHVVNFHPRRIARGLILELQDAAIATLQVFSPNTDAVLTLKGRPGKTGTRFALAPIRHYALIVQS